jgi:hypothetical protein
LSSPSISHPAATKSFNSSFYETNPAFDQGSAIHLSFSIALGERSSHRSRGATLQSC